jgi:glycine hydroxymethyltransferase
MTGRFWRPIRYGVRRDTGRIDMDEVREIARRERPKMIIAGGSAYPRTIDFAAFGEIAREIGAHFLADISHIAGLCVAGAHPSALPHADVVMTTTHKTLRGPRGAMLLCRADLAERIDKAVFPGLQGGPHNQTTAAIGVALKEAATPEFRQYGHQVVNNAKALAAEVLARGYDLVSGGTDNHLILIDLTNKGVIGKKAAKALARAGIVCNYNAVPFDTRKPFSPSGIRLGTPSVTSRGMGEGEMRQVGAWIDTAILAADDEDRLAAIAAEVRAFCRNFPAPGLAVGGGDAEA